MNTKIVTGVFAITLQCTAPVSPSKAGGKLTDIKICNKFPKTIYFAIAYQQKQGYWLSRGWLKVSTGVCYYFDTQLRLSDFYFRAQTEEFHQNGQSTVDSWGNKGPRSFCIDNNVLHTFNDWAADTLSGCSTANARFQSFQEGVNFSPDTDVSYTVTFQADGTETLNFTPLDPNAPKPNVTPVQ